MLYILNCELINVLFLINTHDLYDVCSHARWPSFSVAVNDVENLCLT